MKTTKALKLTVANMKALPALYSQDGKGMDAIAHVKFFNPTGSWTWFATEACATLADGSSVALSDPAAKTAEDIMFFGLVDGHEAELGYFAMSELASVKGKFGLGIERDLHFKPTALKDLKTRASR
jgi:hypothetical protein